MYTHDVYFSTAVDYAFDVLSNIYQLEGDRSLEKLVHHPARDDMIISGLETPYFSSIEWGQTVRIRIWIQVAHSEAWNERVKSSLLARLKRQSQGDGINFLIETFIYPT